MVSSVSASTNPHTWRHNGAARINRAKFRNRAGDLRIYRGINGNFHDTVPAASRNGMLGEMIRTCHRVPVSSSRNIITFEHRDVRHRHDGHHRIYETIIAGEPWRAEWLMREHVSSVKGSLIRALAARNGDQADQTDEPST
jgi:GntR family transcriptional regulator of vanillate catabolism